MLRYSAGLALFLQLSLLAQPTVVTIAGRDLIPDGIRSTLQTINFSTFTVARDGTIYFIADSAIYRQTSQGILSRVFASGSGQCAEFFYGEGLSAAQTAFCSPYWLTTSAQGDLFVSLYQGHRVIRSRNQITTTIAGSSTGNSSGDGGNATAATLNFPTLIHFDAGGSLAVLESSNLRRVTNGIIRPVFRASSAITSLTSDPESNLYFSTAAEHWVIYRIRAGTTQVERYAGGLQPAVAPDGFDIRTNARFSGIAALAWGPDGLYFVERGSRC